MRGSRVPGAAFSASTASLSSPKSPSSRPARKAPPADQPSHSSTPGKLGQPTDCCKAKSRGLAANHDQPPDHKPHNASQKVARRRIADAMESRFKIQGASGSVGSAEHSANRGCAASGRVSSCVLVRARACSCSHVISVPVGNAPTYITQSASICVSFPGLLCVNMMGSRSFSV